MKRSRLKYKWNRQIGYSKSCKLSFFFCKSPLNNWEDGDGLQIGGSLNKRIIEEVIEEKNRPLPTD